MNNQTKYWWLTLLKGIVLIALAFFTFNHPAEALVGLALYIGIALMVTGVSITFAAISNRHWDDQWGWRLAEGIIDILLASILLSNPAITATTFPFIIGFWMIFYGVMLFAGSFGLKKLGNSNWWITLLGGALTVFVGYVIMNNLFAGVFAITFWMGCGILLFGLANISMAFQLKNAKK
ncbi:HdeD family acid-resistance protein [Formosa sp. PL04]|uniref:HdeD family acid-resistance protein n=1 Tax=Formosa sp. PL04 TaxID=3081755 RepID=UPI002981C26C|nr:HdeD family acid-resistance protein [Formosa sp. PL04]MDW5288933.1 HdeD family acid-resistance protein [Formosa sp. PL04]